jgi:hypothetical protein
MIALAPGVELTTYQQLSTRDLREVSVQVFCSRSCSRPRELSGEFSRLSLHQVPLCYMRQKPHDSLGETFVGITYMTVNTINESYAFNA